MIRLAVINSQSLIVDNIIVVQNLGDWIPGEGFECVDVTTVDANIGDTYDGATFLRQTSTVDKQIVNQSILSRLSALDQYLPRAVEDYWNVINFDTSVLPQPMQDKLAEKISLRSQLNGLG